MSITKDIEKVIPNLPPKNLTENFSRYIYEVEKSNWHHSIDKSSILKIVNNISECDTFELIFEIDSYDKIFFSKVGEVESYFRNSSVVTFKHFFRFRLEISKNYGSQIYDFETFILFFKKLSPLGLLSVINENYSDSKHIKLACNEDVNFDSNILSINCDLNPLENNIVNNLNDNCQFFNISTFDYTPEHFIIRSSNIEIISERIKSLRTLFSIISIFNQSKISEGFLDLTLLGYTKIDIKLELDGDFGKKYESAFNLYEWCYSSKGNVSDKLGIARNIISLQIRNSEIIFDDSLLSSIKSAYNTYLKENINQYIELRSNILDELNWISQKSSEIIDKYLSNYGRNSSTILSLFVSIIVIQIISTNSFNFDFTGEIKILCFGFIVISFIYLNISTKVLGLEKARLKRKYENIKLRYKDLLVAEDIENILQNDAEFNYEMNYIDRKANQYTTLWIITLILLSLVVIVI